MSEMVNRVAEAISVSFHEEGNIEGQSDPSLWGEFQKAARAAIAAMREPTPAMMAAAEAITPANCHWRQDGAELPGSGDIWQAMTDEALK